jgi:hypothetical protein
MTDTIEVKDGRYCITGGVLKVVTQRGIQYGWWRIDAIAPTGLDVFSQQFEVGDFWPEIRGKARVVHSSGTVGKPPGVTIEGIGSIEFLQPLERCVS